MLSTSALLERGSALFRCKLSLPEFSITQACETKWPEVIRKHERGRVSSDRAALTYRCMFRLKRNALLQELVETKCWKIPSFTLNSNFWQSQLVDCRVGIQQGQAPAVNRYMDLPSRMSLIHGCNTPAEGCSAWPTRALQPMGPSSSYCTSLRGIWTTSTLSLAKLLAVCAASATVM